MIRKKLPITTLFLRFSSPPLLDKIINQQSKILSQPINAASMSIVLIRHVAI
jgi:hypothetical protein